MKRAKIPWLSRVSYLYQHTISGVATFTGMGGSFQTEWVATFHRNRWQPWTGILKLLAKLGKGAFLETLLLKEDVSPHVHFFTSKGLIQLFQRKGFALESKFKFAEVGAELAERNRGPIGISSMLMRISGVLLEFISPWWADTSVFLFRRDDQADYV